MSNPSDHPLCRLRVMMKADPQTNRWSRSGEFAALLGVSDALLRKVERGNLPMSAKLRRTASRCTGVSEDWLQDPSLSYPTDVEGKRLTADRVAERAGMASFAPGVSMYEREQYSAALRALGVSGSGEDLVQAALRLNRQVADQQNLLLYRLQRIQMLEEETTRLRRQLIEQEEQINACLT